MYPQENGSHRFLGLSAALGRNLHFPDVLSDGAIGEAKVLRVIPSTTNTAYDHTCLL